MYIILGGTGHIGMELSRLLVEKGEQVTIVTHDPEKTKLIEDIGAIAAIADVRDTNRLIEIFKTGKRLYFLNPPAPISADNHKEENKSVDSIIAAIKKSSFEKIVAESTYGAQPGDRLGDLDVLYNMEKSLASINVSTTIIRGAYYYSNWDMFLKTAKEEGKIYSLYPTDFSFPMVDPADIARFAAKFITGPVTDKGLYYVTGPKDYTSAEVAEAIGKAIGNTVSAVEIKPADWKSFLVKSGFSQESAESMVNMTSISLKKGYEQPESPLRGNTTIQDYFKAQASKS